jgi:5-methylthioadenosine/S-adenosylhomocysteine deaminase
MAPHAPYTVADRTFERVVTYAEQLNIPIHVHVHETQDEIRQGLEQYGCRPLARLEKLGLLCPNLIAVHAVHLTPEEIAILAKQGCHAAHCPSSNLKLASGISPVAQMLDAGINVGLGTDGSASNNRLDLFEEMRLAALLAKGASGRADVLPAHQALAMATLGGARALGLDNKIGSLVPGKAADIAAVELSSLETLPCYDPVSHLVYAAGREHVSHVWVGGRLVLEERHLTTLDERDLATRALRWQKAVARSDAEHK